MARSSVRGVVGVSCWLLMGACSSGSETPPVSPIVLRVHQPLNADRPTLEDGADCSLMGRSGCLSGVCVHLSPKLNEGFRCVGRCQTQAQCHAGWRCVDPLRSGESFCIPPPDPETTLRPAGGAR